LTADEPGGLGQQVGLLKHLQGLRCGRIDLAMMVCNCCDEFDTTTSRVRLSPKRPVAWARVRVFLDCSLE
jgi:hypothetical protein